MDGTWNSGNFRFWKRVRVPCIKFPQKKWFWKCPLLVLQILTKQWVWKTEQLPTSKSPLSAIHKIVWHIWEDGSRKVNVNEPNLRIYHGNFWPVMSQAVRKPCFSISIPRGEIPRFPDAAGAGDGRTLKSRSRPSQRVQGWNTSASPLISIEVVSWRLRCSPKWVWWPSWVLEQVAQRDPNYEQYTANRG